MRAKVILVVATVLVAAGAWYWWKQTHRSELIVRTNPWSTKSAKTQGGLRLIAIQQEMPDEVKQAGVKLQTYYKYHQFAWFDVVDQTLLPGSKQHGYLVFSLAGKDGSNEHLELADEGRASGDIPRYIAVAVPLGYGPQDVNGSLVAHKNQKIIGSWKLEDMAKPVKQIRDDEKDVTRFEAVGLSFQEKEPSSVRYVHMAADKSTRLTLSSVQFDVKSTASVRSDDQYEVTVQGLRSTWYAGQQGGSLTMQVKPEHRLFIVGQLPYLRVGDRVEQKLQFRRYRTYEEPVVLKNVAVEPTDIEYGDRGEYQQMRLAKPITFTTPSGLEVTLHKNRQNMFVENGSLSIAMSCKQGLSKIQCAGSPLFKATDKPISLSLALDDHGRKISQCTSKDGEEGRVFMIFEYSGKAVTKPAVIPELKVVLIQRADLEEKTVTIRYPVEKVTRQR